MLRSLLAATTLSLAVLATTPVLAEETKMPRTISLVGHGESRVAPDMAIVNVGVLKQAATAAEALAANTEAMTAVIAALKAAGIEQKDIQTSDFMVAPRYDYGDNTQPPKLMGYDVSNNVTVIVRSIATLGGLLDTLVSAGSNQVNGISFQVSKPDAALDDARKLATEDATRKARLYAAAMQLELGPVLSLSEGASYTPPSPVMMKTMRGSAEMSADVPVAAGEQVLSIDVNVTWEIN
jgi:uncharacterized protein